MTTTPIDLPALVGSRICHDLISPLGAISNGVELIGLSGSASSPEMALIAESVENANARIRFFRISFGASDPTQEIGASEIQDILDGICRSGRLSINWHPDHALSRSEIKLAFLLIQCLETAMPFGGTVEVHEDDGFWMLVGRSDRLKFETETWDVLAHASGTITVKASEVHFGLVPELVQRMGRVLETRVTDTKIEISF